jgi:hypothetical protein
MLTAVIGGAIVTEIIVQLDARGRSVPESEPGMAVPSAAVEAGRQ